MKDLKAKSIPEFITAKSGNKTGNKSEITDAALANLKNYSEKLLSLNYYKKGNTSSPEKVADSSHSTGEKSSIKTARPLEHFDCIQAPCITTCPTNQDIPQYMYHTMKGEFHKAFEAILKKNSFPAVTGMVCDHLCMTKCTRINYDNPLQIRAIKRFVSENHAEEPQLKHATPTGAKVAIIGAGPSGLSCAYFLAQAGVEVSVYETKSIPGGMVADAIPAFRLRDADIKKDIQRIEKLGVQIHYNTKVDAPLFRKLQKENDFVYIGIGAQENYPMELKGEDAPGVIDALTFLSKVRRQQPMELGSKVAIIGGGNSAMDAARTAWRMVKGKDAEVIVLYRRTRKEMPADNEEIEAVLEEGIKIIELAAPAEIEGDNGRLKVLCWKMELGEKDDSGRRRPVKIEGADFHLYFDTLIPAIGQVTQLDFLEKQNLRPVKVSGETAIQHVYMGGDALRGPLNIITAIADGKKSAAEILNAAILTGRVSLRPSALKELMHEMTVPAADIGSEDFAIEDYQMKAARRGYGYLPEESTPGNRRNFHMVIEPLTEESARKEASRCLLCSDICNVCVSVCPNRANYSYEVEPKVYRLEKAYRHDWKMEYAVDMVFDLKQKFQVYNIADFCNECGNCQTFCPTAGAPYKDKPRVCLTETSFNNEDNAFFMETKDGKPIIHSKHEGKKESLQLDKDKYLYESEEVSAVFNKASFKIEKAEFKNHTLKEANFRRAL
ncbi:MAG: FAD-dependent oxidoreductase [bacterium]|nr:FAD-dependent oxidoreductase [bacterium]